MLCSCQLGAVQPFAPRLLQAQCSHIHRPRCRLPAAMGSWVQPQLELLPLQAAPGAPFSHRRRVMEAGFGFTRIRTRSVGSSPSHPLPAVPAPLPPSAEPHTACFAASEAIPSRCPEGPSRAASVLKDPHQSPSPSFEPAVRHRPE